jgi:hypothetical protein
MLPIFAELYLTDDANEDAQEKKPAQRRRGKPAKRVMRSI